MALNRCRFQIDGEQSTFRKTDGVQYKVNFVSANELTVVGKLTQPSPTLASTTFSIHASVQGRRITHPGESVVGVMTAHPAWPQSQYDKNLAGLSSSLRGAPS
jgi:hypothetical protein